MYSLLNESLVSARLDELNAEVALVADRRSARRSPRRLLARLGTRSRRA